MGEVRTYQPNRKQQTGCSKQEAANRVQQTGSSKQEAANRVQQTGCSKQGAANRKQQTRCRPAGHLKLSYVYNGKGETEVARKAVDPKAKVNISE